MKRIITSFIVIMLFVNAVLIVNIRAKAEGTIECYDSQFPQSDAGWTIDNGTILDDRVYLYDDSSGDIHATLTLPRVENLYSINISAIRTSTPVLPTGWLNITILVKKSSQNSGLAQTVMNYIIWETSTIYFPANIEGDEIVVVAHLLEGVPPSHATAINIGRICLNPRDPFTETPTGTLPTSLPASNTPSPTLTVTPGGPSVTPIIDSLSSQSTLGPFIDDPSSCSSTSCGIMPPVPKFPTVDLPTVTRVLSFTPRPTATITPTPEPQGTQTAQAMMAGVSTTVNDYKNTSSTLVAANSTPSIELNGETQTIDSVMTTLTDPAITFFGTIKGFAALPTNRVYQVLFFAILLVIFVVLIKLATFFFPLIKKFILFILELLQSIPFFG